MSKTTTNTARIDSRNKRETEKALKDFEKAKPFAASIPSAETATAIESAIADVDLHTAESVDALFEDLES